MLVQAMPYPASAGGGGGGSGITANQLRVRPVTHGGPEDYWSVGECEFLDGSGIFPSGYTIISSGTITGLAQIFDGAPSRSYMPVVSTTSWFGVKYPTAQTIEKVGIRGPDSWNQQFPRQWVIEYRDLDTDPWTLADTIYSGEPAVSEWRHWPIQGNDDPSGYRYYMFEADSAYDGGSIATMSEFQLLDANGVSCTRDFGGAYGSEAWAATANASINVWWNGVFGDDTGYLSGLPGNIVWDFVNRRAFPTAEASARSSATYYTQFPKQCRIKGSNDNVTWTTLFEQLDGSAPALTAGETKTWTLA